MGKGKHHHPKHAHKHKHHHMPHLPHLHHHHGDKHGKVGRLGAHHMDRHKWQGGEEERQLREQVGKLGLEVVDIEGDGNCMFRALMHQYKGTQHAHGEARARVVQYLSEHRADYEAFVEDDTSFDDYLAEMGRDRVYGDQLALVAFVQAYQVDVFVHQVGKPVWILRAAADNRPAARQMHIIYYDWEHYDALQHVSSGSHDKQDKGIFLGANDLHAGADSASEGRRAENTAPAKETSDPAPAVDRGEGKGKGKGKGHGVHERPARVSKAYKKQLKKQQRADKAKAQAEASADAPEVQLDSSVGALML
ncbi:uncharacterized protein MONBRDRAFT_10797 [Monosiga brevicollis MX1]|uniref:OTU domain-containing protein n=1 Tax=Monosiga brevicollis TaxID=81824 RepID=A9V797_MONBE|nr:uncharacterized protein MONBRDRAFT_10797 [Monosiga brevicollis MX1]EDQ86478.1 predicted protein [Monosiga brevicollis MX1]|eukprot:XP_001748591.1 hypothetical protein [Monosiga brevicollis MX1]